MGEVKRELAGKASIMVRSRIILIRWSVLIGCTIYAFTCLLSLAYGQGVSFGLNGLEWENCRNCPVEEQKRKYL